MHCLCCLSLVLLGVFQMFKPVISQDWITGALHEPEIVKLGTRLAISCSGKSLFGKKRHCTKTQKTHEVAILKLKEKFKTRDTYALEPELTWKMSPVANWKTTLIGSRKGRYFVSSGKHFTGMGQVGVRLFTDMSCEDYGLYQCHEILENPNEPPRTIYVHTDFYVDFVDHTPKLTAVPNYGRYIPGSKLNITCEQSTREHNVVLGVAYKPDNFLYYGTLEGLLLSRYQINVTKAPCGGYSVYHLTVSVYIDLELWNSKIICVANRPRIQIRRYSQYFRDNLVSNPLVLSACAPTYSPDCQSTVSGIPSVGRSTADTGNKVAVYTLLPVLILILFSILVLIGAVLKIVLQVHKQAKRDNTSISASGIIAKILYEDHDEEEEDDDDDIHDDELDKKETAVAT